MRPKPLCPVYNVALVDLAVARVRAVAGEIAVNVHHGRDRLESHLRDAGVHISVEERQPLGTAGAVGNLREWIGGRPVLVCNADAVHREHLRALTHGWDGERLRLLVVDAGGPSDFGRYRFAGASLMPWAEASRLRPEPSGLYEVCWRGLIEAGRAELIVSAHPFFDCGTVAEYLGANMYLSGGHSVIGAGAVVEGGVRRAVVWPGSRVRPGESLADCVRAGPHTLSA